MSDKVGILCLYSKDRYSKEENYYIVSNFLHDVVGYSVVPEEDKHNPPEKPMYPSWLDVDYHMLLDGYTHRKISCNPPIAITWNWLYDGHRFQSLSTVRRYASEKNNVDFYNVKTVSNHDGTYNVLVNGESMDGLAVSRRKK